MTNWFKWPGASARKRRLPPAPAPADDAHSIHLYAAPTPETFDETTYLAYNADVVAAIAAGHFKSGRDHFDRHGHHGNHRVPLPHAAALGAMRAAKAARIAAIMRPDIAPADADGVFDVLTEAMRTEFGVIDTKNVSAGLYDPAILDLIARHKGGLILDCGAGSRPVYYDNVVNYEIVRYPSTDVVGVAEQLPFADGSFDAVISIAVLEHVKQPFLAAREISRVLKPGGTLRVAVPFLQPLHGYPSHYFNMTQFGLQTLFEADLEILEQGVAPYAGPIWALHMILKAWHEGLPPPLRKQFLAMTLKDFMVYPTALMDKPVVTALTEQTNLAIASATCLVARKPS